jgi:hypothetical protein
VQKEHEIVPQISIEQISGSRGASPDEWIVTWRIQNLGAEPLQLLTAWLPHSRFKSEEREMTDTLSPGEMTQLKLPVAWREPAGTVVENAFLILRVLWLNQPWRVFARLRVFFDDRDGLETMTEVVTAHPVGFSSP